MFLITGFEIASGREVLLTTCRSAEEATSTVRTLVGYLSDSHHYLTWYGSGDGRDPDDYARAAALPWVDSQAKGV